MCRLGPLSIEQKKRAAIKRSKLEKNKEDQRKPQELREEDITRSQNETTKNVAIVGCNPRTILWQSQYCSLPAFWKKLEKSTCSNSLSIPMTLLNLWKIFSTSLF